MSRRISIKCKMTDSELLKQTVEELELEYTETSDDLLKFYEDENGDSLFNGGLSISMDSEEQLEAHYDEDCAKSENLLTKIQQYYVRNHYLNKALLQGDQIQREYVSDGTDNNPLIQEGDIVILASKM